MTSQLVIFRAFYFWSPDPKSEKNPSKSTNKKILALEAFMRAKQFLVVLTTTESRAKIWCQ